jgi:LysW-gamma-L-lysine carboxypeptidase
MRPDSPSAAEAIDLLQQLVSIPSPSRQEAEASAWLTSWMTAHGFDACVDEVGNAVGRQGVGPRRIVLLGHIDTFSGDLPVARDGDWLSGRGTVDAKGSLCAFAAAGAAVEAQPGWQIVVVGAVEEETTSSHGARYLLSHGQRPQFCIIGEPSDWERITLGYKGRLVADVHWRAPFSHSAGPGRLPAEQAVALWQAIVAHCETFNADHATAFDRVEPSLRHIATQDEGAYCMVDMTVGFRLPPSLTPETLADEIRPLVQAQLARIGSQESGVGSQVSRLPTLTFSGEEVAFRTDKNNPLVRAFLSSIRQHGGQPRFVVKTGTSDMNVVGPAWGVPIVAYGPGDSALDHTPEERINLSEYLQSIEVIHSVLEALQRNIP